MEYIAFDSHKRYTFASVQDRGGTILKECRINHERGALKKFLSEWEPGTSVAVETVGNWYWIVDEIEQAGMVPRLVHARRAKMMLASTNKTDKLDCHGLNRLQQTGTLPTVWIAPAGIRDLRELPRTRMALSQDRTKAKNRIHAILAKYGLSIEGVSDIFGATGRQKLQECIKLLPPHSQFALQCLLSELAEIQEEIHSLELRMKESFACNAELELLQSIPGVGFILSVVILLEVGDIGRFPSAGQFAAYAGTTPRVHSSGDRTRYGQLQTQVNRYLKWAFMEAGNVICLQNRNHPYRHASQLYLRIRQRRGHQKAVGAVARHMAESTYWILSKGQGYREPGNSAVLSTRRQARCSHELCNEGS